MRGDNPGGPIRWRMHIPVPPEQVYQALSTDRGRASFWAESAIESGGRVAFSFANGDRYESKILESLGPGRFSLEYIEGIATFEMTASAAGGTDLLLVHTGVGPQDWNEVHAGWLNVLFPLKAVLVCGVDLRNHDPKRTWDQGYADQ